MGQRFSTVDYAKLKNQPEYVAGMDIETINTIVYSHMINDIEDYSVLHRTLQTFSSMSPDRLILTAKRQNIPLTPLIESMGDRNSRINILLSISRYCKMHPEYYVRWPIEMKSVILQYIQMGRTVSDIFDFGSFTHTNVLNICNSITFENERLNRPEDKILIFLRPQIESMFEYLLKTNPRLSVIVIFRMIEAFYKSSTRVVHGLGDTKIIVTERDYPVVPRLPAEVIPEIIQYLSDKHTDPKEYLRLSNLE